jgi:beta-galactosidase/beta-glucuronidase
VTIGFWLSHDPRQYLDDKYRSKMRLQVEQTVENFKEHAGVLMWAIGNETNMTADTEECFLFINGM